jgi:hypothetical protein
VTAAAADQVIFRLETAGVLRALRDEPFLRSGRPARRWQVNPALYDKGPALPVPSAVEGSEAEGVAEIAQTPSQAGTLDVAATPTTTPKGVAEIAATPLS